MWSHICFPPATQCEKHRKLMWPHISYLVLCSPKMCSFPLKCPDLPNLQILESISGVKKKPPNWSRNVRYSEIIPRISWCPPVWAGEGRGATHTFTAEVQSHRIRAHAASQQPGSTHTGTCCYDNCGFLWQQWEILKSTGTESLPV